MNMHNPPSTKGATPVEIDDEGFEIVGNEALSGHMFGQAETLPPIMRQATAVATDGDTASPPPTTASALLRASMASQKDEADMELRAIETQIIAAQGIRQERDDRAKAIRDAAVAHADTIMARSIRRNAEDEADELERLADAKADAEDRYAMATAGCEARSVRP